MSLRRLVPVVLPVALALAFGVALTHAQTPTAAPPAPTTVQVPPPAPIACAASTDCNIAFRRVYRISESSGCGACPCCPDYQAFYVNAASGALPSDDDDAIACDARDESATLEETLDSESDGSSFDSGAEADALQSTRRPRRPRTPVTCNACPTPAPVRTACVSGMCQVL